MTPTFRFYLGACIALLIFTSATVVQAQVTESDVEAFDEYTVKKGDTCTSIAKEFYGDVYAYDVIHAFNDLSTDNYACVEGRTLTLPRLKPRPEAAVARAVGSVKSAPPEGSWIDAERGTELYRSWKVNTLERARAELAFQDQSDLTMNENTLVVVYGPRSSDVLARNVPRAEVERGRLKARLSQLSGGLDVDTPSARTEMQSGRNQITVDDEGTTRVENHAGAPVKVQGRGKASGRSVDVKSGFGTQIEKEKAPQKPRPLPPTPTWDKDDETLAVVFEDETATLKASWEPVKQAARYYVELSRDRRGIDIFFAGFVDKGVNQIEVQDVPPGTYHAIVSAVDKELFESVPSRARQFRVESLSASGDAVVDLDTEPVQLLLGSVLTAPAGRSCGFESSARQIPLDSTGKFTLTCEGREQRATRAIEVVPPRLSDPPESFELTRSQIGTFELAFEPARVRGIQLNAPEGIKANAFANEDSGLVIQLVADSTAQDGELTLTAHDEVIGRIPLTIQDAPDRSTDGIAIPIWLSALGGYVPDGPNLDLRVGIITAPWFGAEFRVAPGYELDDEAFNLEVGAHSLLGWHESFFAFHGLAGLGLRAEFDDDVEPFVRLGAGIAPALSENIRLRLEGGLNVIPEEEVLGIAPFGSAGITLIW